MTNRAGTEMGRMRSPDVAFVDFASVLRIDMAFRVLGVCIPLPAVETVRLLRSHLGIYIPAAFEGPFLKVNPTNVGDRLSLASEAPPVRTGGICTAMVCLAIITGLDRIIIQIRRAREGADLAERVLGKLGRGFKETLAQHLRYGVTESHGMTAGVLHPHEWV
jgi:hypothetical protein